MKKYQIGLGSFPLKDELINIIPLAENLEYSILDTSDDYNNEYIIGNVINEKYKIKIFTKFSAINQIFRFDEHFNNSNTLLSKNGAKISCYLMHWPYPFLYKKIRKRMEKLYLEKKVDEIGVCNFTKKNLKKLLKTCKIKPMYNQIEIHPLFQQKDTVVFCEQNGIDIISYSPFARMDKELFGNELLISMAKEKNVPITSLILKWNLEKGYIPIPSTGNKLHLEQMAINIIDDISISKEEIEEIDRLECGKRIRFNPDTYFSLKQKMKFLIVSLLLIK